MPRQNDEAPLEILLQTAHFIAIHKPAGLLVHRTNLDRHETRFAVQLLRDQIGRHVWPAHRLDRGTSGVLLFGLSPNAQQALTRQFEQRSVSKRYLAIVRGHPEAEGLIDHPLPRIRDDYDRIAQRATATPEETRTATANGDERDQRNPETAPTDERQSALTHYRRLERYLLPWSLDRWPSSRYALLELTPETGRRHQIRRHLKHLAHPIIGDATYGKGPHNRKFAEAFGHGRLWLACTQMGFHDPFTGQTHTIDCQPAKEFREVIAHLQAYRSD